MIVFQTLLGPAPHALVPVGLATPPLLLAAQVEARPDKDCLDRLVDEGRHLVTVVMHVEESLPEICGGAVQKRRILVGRRDQPR